MSIVTNHFSDLTDKITGKQMLQRMKQSNSEPLTAFTERVLSTAYDTYNEDEIRTSSPQKTIIETILRGMKSHAIARKLMCRSVKFTTVDALITEALSLERANSAFELLRQGVISSTHTYGKEIKPLITETQEEDMDISLLRHQKQETGIKQPEQKVHPNKKIQNQLNEIQMEQKINSQGLDDLAYKLNDMGVNNDPYSDGESNCETESSEDEDNEDDDIDTNTEDMPDHSKADHMIAYVKSGRKSKKEYDEYKKKLERNDDTDKKYFDFRKEKRTYYDNNKKPYDRKRKMDDRYRSRSSEPQQKTYAYRKPNKTYRSNSYDRQDNRQWTSKRNSTPQYKNSRWQKEIKWDGDVPICLYCDKSGHMKKECAQRMRDENYRPDNKRSNHFL